MHPVEVVGRIREHPDARCSPAAAVYAVGDEPCVRVKTEQGYRDFLLDGVSFSGNDKLPDLYARYVASRVEDVRCGGRCTILMYGPTGAGKSHTMFGSTKEPGVAYLALQHVMSKAVQVSANVLEVYNEEVYDLLAATSSSNSTPISSPGLRSVKSAISGRPKLEVRGRKVRNATSICSVDPTQLVQEIAKVEKRRVVKSTCGNDRSSRSHCMVVLDVVGVGGKLVLVDMAGSENSEQAGSSCTESKLQTGRINQGNGALKRVVESIASGSPYIPYRDSKLTMLLQDSFEVDGSKILMILCASPDPRDVYKTICTLEYGAKAKCIVRLPTSPHRDGSTQNDTEAVLQARLRVKDECLETLRVAFEQRTRDHELEQERLAEREAELAELRTRLTRVQAECSRKMAECKTEMDSLVELSGQELRATLELNIRERKLPVICSVVEQERLAELERVVEVQKQDIALLRMRAETAEAGVVRILQSTRLMAESCDEEQGLLRLDSKQLTQVVAVESLTSWASSHTASPKIAADKEVGGHFISEEFNFSCMQRSSAAPLASEQVPCDSGADAGVYVYSSPPSSAARRARIENIFQLCGDERERCKPGIKSRPRPGCPLRSVENQAVLTPPFPPPAAFFSGDGENRRPSD